MTTTSVFQQLEAEGIWTIDQRVRDKFNARSLYKRALHEDVAWREWNKWIRDQIVSYLGRSNRISSSRKQSHHQRMSTQSNQQILERQHSRQLSYVSTTSTISGLSGISGATSPRATSPRESIHRASTPRAMTPGTPLTPEPSTPKHDESYSVRDPNFKSIFIAESTQSMVEGVIQNCNLDIEDINEQFECHIAPIVRESGKVYKAKIGRNGLPSGFAKRSMICPLILRGKNSEEFLRNTEPGVYSCHRCYGTVFAVGDASEFKKRVVNQQCVRIVYEMSDHHQTGCSLM